MDVTLKRFNVFLYVYNDFLTGALAYDHMLINLHGLSDMCVTLM